MSIIQRNSLNGKYVLPLPGKHRSPIKESCQCGNSKPMRPERSATASCLIITFLIPFDSAFSCSTRKLAVRVQNRSLSHLARQASNIAARRSPFRADLESYHTGLDVSLHYFHYPGPQAPCAKLR